MTGSVGVDTNRQAMGYVLGGAAAGLIIGALLPGFKGRWTAGMIVWFAMTVGLSVLAYFWDKGLTLVQVVVLGLFFGAGYAAFFWKLDFGRDKPKGS
jgi:hypothetical protein